MTRIRNGFRGEMGQTAPLGYGRRKDEDAPSGAPEAAPAPEGGLLGPAGQAAVESAPTGHPAAFEWTDEDWTVATLDAFADQNLDEDTEYPYSSKKADKLAWLNGQDVNPVSLEAAARELEVANNTQHEEGADSNVSIDLSGTEEE